MSKSTICLVAESGSTKTDWIALDSSGNISNTFKTAGYNPYYLSSNKILEDISSSDLQTLDQNNINEIHFYGAGCSNQEHSLVVAKALEKYFHNARVFVEHDLLAAARSAFSGQPLICGILGTGSNCCYFNGQELSQETPSLGFMLGDEGGGAQIGRAFIVDYLYNRLPKKLSNDFRTRYKLNLEEVLNKVYHEERPNTFLARFVEFLGEYKTEEYVQDLICSQFRAFAKAHIVPYQNHFPCEIHFVGSVAFHFQDLMRGVLNEYGLELSGVVSNPLDGLIEYHRKTMK